MKKWIVLFSVVTAMQAVAVPVLEQSVVKRAMTWMHQHPVMGPAGRSVASVEVFPDSGQRFVYVVHLSPKGYLILNPDEHPSLVVSFSPDASVDLSAGPDNAFRSMLLCHVAHREGQLAQSRTVLGHPSSGVEAMTELHGPFLDTAWNQSHPYNKLCPTVPHGLKGYNDRAPTGCVATAYAQLLQFHRWPFFGKGAHAYTDNSGPLTGTQEADFSDPYDWASMLTSYSVFDANPPEAENAVAELMLELGIAAEADYEAGGTTASTWSLGDSLGEHFFFEPIEYHAWQADLTASMERDLRAGLPCVVSIPGHAVVVDGLMVDQGVTTYHINYGWGGENNGWWTVNNVAGSPIEYGITSLRPRLMAVPQIPVVRSVLDEPVELRWILPKRREDEAAQLNINRLEQQAGTWQSDASDITAGQRSGWHVASDGHSGDCWFAGPNGPAWMTLDEIFVPDASANLTFWLSRRLGTATFSVEGWADNGRTRTEIYSDNDRYSLAWERITLPLAAFAGQSVNLRFALSYGSYYQDTGGVWVDDLTVTSGDWFAWQFLASFSTQEVTYPELEGQPVYVTTLADLPAGTHTLAATVVDANDVEHGVAPSLTLTVSDTHDGG